jgi:hypothetical protein
MKPKACDFVLEPELDKEVILKIYRGVEQLVARWAHNPKVTSSSLVPATRVKATHESELLFCFYPISRFGSYPLRRTQESDMVKKVKGFVNLSFYSMAVSISF